MTIGARTGPDAGKFQVAIADDPAGPWTAARRRARRLRGAVGLRLVRAVRGAVRDGRREAGALLGDRARTPPAPASQLIPRLHRRRRGARPPVRSRISRPAAITRCAAADRRRRPLLGRQRLRPARRRRRRRSRAARPPSTSSRASPPSRRGAAHTCVLSSRRGRALLGRQRQRPARRRHRPRRARRRPARPVLVGREGDRGGPAPHLRAHDRRRRPLLGRQRLRPARRRHDHRPLDGRPTADVLSGVKAIAAGGAAHLRAHDRRRRPLLGRQRPGPARRRDDDRPLDAARRGRRRRRRGGQRRRHAHLRADERGRRPLLGTQPATASSASATTTPCCRRPSTDVLSGVKQVVAGNAVHVRAH